MKTQFVAFLALAFTILAGASLAAQPPGPRRGPAQVIPFQWFSNIKEGKAEALKSGKPIMVVLRCVP